jgi:hypothetical protein
VLTFLICKHFADSVKPTISSGEQTFTKGKSEFFASCAARAVFPEFGGPSSRTETRPDVSVDRACCMNKIPSSRILLTGVPQLMIPLARKCSSTSALVPKACKRKVYIEKGIYCIFLVMVYNLDFIFCEVSLISQFYLFLLK